MTRATFRAGICAAALTGALALSGTAAVGSAHASDENPDRRGPTPCSHANDDQDHAVPAVVTSWSKVHVRDAPTVHAPAVSTLPAGAHIRLFCQTTGDRVDGTSVWYFDNDAHGWVSAAHAHPTGWQPLSC